MQLKARCRAKILSVRKPKIIPVLQIKYSLWSVEADLGRYLLVFPSKISEGESTLCPQIGSFLVFDLFLYISSTLYFVILLGGYIFRIKIFLFLS